MGSHAPEGCDFCGTSIPLSDFKKGRAVILLKKKYCHGCMEETIKRGKLGQKPSPHSSRIQAAGPDPLPVAPSAPSGPPPPLRLGDHACALYGSEEARRQQVAAFLADGIRNGEKIFYAVDDASSERVAGYLKDLGADVAGLIRRGLLEIHRTPNVFAPGGSFDPTETVSRMKMMVDRAMKDGHPGVRACLEATWALRGWPGSEKLGEYELRLNALFPDLRGAVLCQYDVLRFSPEFLRNLKASHAQVLA